MLITNQIQILRLICLQYNIMPNLSERKLCDEEQKSLSLKPFFLLSCMQNILIVLEELCTTFGWLQGILPEVNELHINI